MNKNYIDRISNTEYFANATCFTVNKDKDIPFWHGCTDREKHSKDFSKERANMYRRQTDRRREFKSFVDRVVNDVSYRAWLADNLNLVKYANAVSNDRQEFYDILGLPMP